MKPSPTTTAFRPHFIGAGTAMALVIIVLLVTTQLYKRKYTTPPPRPKVTSEFRLPREPEMNAMLAQADALGLTQEQRGKLEKLRNEWRADSQPVIAEMKRLDEELTGYLNESQKKGSLNVNEFQKRAARISSATREYRGIHKNYQQKAEKILTRDQLKKWIGISKQGGGQP
jgi:Spy/CpxP family protein refolding chaperone